MTNAYADLLTLKSSGVLNITGTSLDARLLALLEDVSRWVDTYCNRHFFVLTSTRVFDGNGARELQLPDLISITTLKTDENQDRVFELTWSSGDYLLYPLNAEPQQAWGRPYSRVVVDTEAGSRPAFPAGRSTVEITGKWGFREVVENSGADINEGGPFSATDTTLTVTDGSLLAPGKTVLIDSEQLYITAIAANDLTVVRGVNGTTAATHSNGTGLSVFRYPGSVVEACLLQVSRLWKKEANAGFSQANNAAASELDPDVRRLLSSYRRLPIGLGV